jgi:hypothetical protein
MTAYRVKAIKPFPCAYPYFSKVIFIQVENSIIAYTILLVIMRKPDEAVCFRVEKV